MNKSPVSYSRLAEAVSFYQRKGWKYIETPWIVKPSIHETTVPFTSNEQAYYDNKLPDGFLVGSAEQGFVQLADDERIEPGKYCSISPCFRSEADIDYIHYRNFIKLELFWYLGKTWEVSYDSEVVNNTVHDAFVFMGQYMSTLALNVLEKDRQVDINESITGVELGSYAIRQQYGFVYVCGTGLAEPRFSTIYDHLSSQAKLSESSI